MKVALIGDSIRIYSEPFVRACLPATFEVNSPPVNCKSSDEVARLIRAWIPPATVHMVHINCGLHDLRRDSGQSQPVNSLEEYAANLRSVFSYLASTGVSVIWATTTPVNEALHGSPGMPRWHTADIAAYNQVSTGLALSYGFGINDLYGRLAEGAPEALHLADGVHFNRTGNELIGRYVADAILTSLS